MHFLFFFALCIKKKEEEEKKSIFLVLDLYGSTVILIANEIHCTQEGQRKVERMLD